MTASRKGKYCSRRGTISKKNKLKFSTMLACCLFVLLVFSGFSTCHGHGIENDTVLGNSTVTPLLIVSFDGFKADYLKKYSFPNLEKFFSDGVLVDHVSNVFITKTFPNHYSIVTGRYAESHGILSSSMYDPDTKNTFSLSHDSDSFWWEQATPLWVSIQQKGYKSAAAMWPGTDIKIHNLTASYYLKYQHDVPFQERVDNLTKWLSQDLVKFATLYWEEPDYSGHLYGPDNITEMTKALKQVDDHIGYLIDKLKQTGLWSNINIIITSDHGMVQCAPDRLIRLDDCIGPNNYTLVDFTPVSAILPLTNVTYIYELLKKCNPHMKAYMKEDIPDRLHYKNNRRIQPIILVADEGWTIVQNGSLPRLGDHGYDNTLPSMHPFLAAHGPAFRKGYRLNSINTVDIYSLMCHLLRLEEQPNNGTFTNTKCMLASQWCVNLPEVIGIVIGVFIVLTALTCLIVMKNKASPSSRAFARLELQDDDDDDPLIG
ncbi:bis(5'-adenosyl)-triphosphatase enpp4-like [Acipenser oxyrinchus oxyrinchus]|uniref:bis(5'-adenosyl)-triphosphatase n=1 Tax=Acipenser oxyrinchus oxyrinchus TaxID=40147 RepID=A0AAD8GC89_ACIOX|nr:bis(5'-adenosyl)-triphosphatase enpp4-like [Acipenser oxyrinchus oxyrinchus]